MPQNKYSTFKREELGHSKKLSDQNKTETHQDKHLILQLHVRYLGLSRRLGRPAALAACAHTACPGWLHSVPLAFSAAVHGSTPSNPEVSLQFRPYSHILTSQGLLEVTPSLPRIAWPSVILQNLGRKLQGPSVFCFLYWRWLILPRSAASLGPSLAPWTTVCNSLCVYFPRQLISRSRTTLSTPSFVDGCRRSFPGPAATPK